MIPISYVYTILRNVLPNKVFYGLNVVNEADTDVFPFIVYQEISNRAVVYADNQTILRQRVIQIVLVTSKKDPALESNLHDALSEAGFNFQMVTEYLNEQGTVHRVYEIKMED